MRQRCRGKFRAPLCHQGPEDGGRERATKEAILIKAGRFTRLAGPKALAAWDDRGQSGDRKNDSCQAGGGKEPPEGWAGELRWAVGGCSVMRINS